MGEPAGICDTVHKGVFVSVGARVVPVAWLASAAWAGTAASSDATSTYAPRAKHFLDRLTSTSMTIVQKLSR